MGIKLPFNVDSFRSFKVSQKRIHYSNLQVLLDSSDSVKEAVQAAFKKMAAH
jgi:hypothetical protein